jgi:hypothetical protein
MQYGYFSIWLSVVSQASCPSSVPRIIEMILFFLIGALFAYATIGSLFAGIRLLASKTFLPFHQQAVGILWSDIPEGIRVLILALMRVAGIGTLVTAVLCLLNVFPSFFGINRLLSVLIGGCTVIYWLTIFGITLYVHKRTNANTPFKSSFSVFVVTLIATIARTLL